MPALSFISTDFKCLKDKIADINGVCGSEYSYRICSALLTFAGRKLNVSLVE
jgi:hypothetical protein